MKKIQRTAYWPGPAPVDPADRDGVTVPPEPTPKASTPPACGRRPRSRASGRCRRRPPGRGEAAGPARAPAPEPRRRAPSRRRFARLDSRRRSHSLGELESHLARRRLQHRAVGRPRADQVGVRCGGRREEQGDQRCSAPRRTTGMRVIMPTVLFEQYVEEGLGCASYLSATSTREASRGRSGLRRRASTSRPPSARASASRASSRRTRTPITSQGTAGSRSSTAVPVPFTPRRSGVPVRAARRTERRSRSAQVSLRVIHTPGHRPEHCCFAVADRSRATEPWLVLTGDSLLVGDAARPDLAVEATEGAEGLFHSLRRLLELPTESSCIPGTSPARSAARA